MCGVVLDNKGDLGFATWTNCIWVQLPGVYVSGMKSSMGCIDCIIDVQMNITFRAKAPGVEEEPGWNCYTRQADVRFGRHGYAMARQLVALVSASEDPAMPLRSLH